MEIEFALPNILSGTIKEIYQLNKVIIFSRSLFEFFHPSGGGPTFPQSFQTQFACGKARRTAGHNRSSTQPNHIGHKNNSTLMKHEFKLKLA